MELNDFRRSSRFTYGVAWYRRFGREVREVGSACAIVLNSFCFKLEFLAWAGDHIIWSVLGGRKSAHDTLVS